MSTSNPSIIGGACIISSICVGAGMLALPTAGSGIWTLGTIIILLVTMIIMSLSGIMLLEAFKYYPYGSSFNTVTKSLLGNKINIINNISVYFVGGILIYAYISSAGLILSELLGVSTTFASLIFVLVFSSIVWHSTKAVDKISVLLITFMILSFVISIISLLVNIEPRILFNLTNQDELYMPYGLALIPIALTSFGYHHSVSTMRDYYKSEYKARKAIILGTLIALALYSLWIVSIFGNIPRSSFSSLINNDGNIDDMLRLISNSINSASVSFTLEVFSIAAILSSFIGVGLGLFDYLADLFKFKNTIKGRSKTWAVTFLPPLICSLIFPFGFIVAIGYAGAAATIWACIIPVLLVAKVRAIYPHKNGVSAPKSKYYLFCVLFFGIITSLLHFSSMLNILPIYGKI
ncbi:transposase [Photobacterium damselae]|nr:transposase [Photobacterium damselae]